MAATEDLIKAAEPFAQTVRSAEILDLERRADYALDNQGNVIDRARTFIRLQSPDGSVWRVKIDNAGVLSPSKET